MLVEQLYSNKLIEIFDLLAPAFVIEGLPHHVPLPSMERCIAQQGSFLPKKPGRCFSTSGLEAIGTLEDVFGAGVCHKIHFWRHRGGGIPVIVLLTSEAFHYLYVFFEQSVSVPSRMSG